jgi:hypothetical protein
MWPLPNVAKIGQAGQRGFEGETFAAPRALPDFFQHQASSPDRGGFRREWRKAGGNQVSIDEPRQMCLGR